MGNRLARIVVISRCQAISMGMNGTFPYLSHTLGDGDRYQRKASTERIMNTVALAKPEAIVKCGINDAPINYYEHLYHIKS